MSKALTQLKITLTQTLSRDTGRGDQRALAVLMALFLLAGCARDQQASTRKIYNGPTVPLTQLVEEINRNNLRLPTLWSRHYFEVTFLDDKKQSHTVNGDGVLMYMAPQSMYLDGTKPMLDKKIFEIGSNNQRFWLTIPQVDTMWWGDYSKIDTIDSADIPVRPDLIVQVLGIGAIDTDFTHEPAPVMRFNNDADAYMIVWSARLPDRWVAQREVWYDRATKLPRIVLLFDENGRVVLRAYLSNHQPVESNDPEHAPKVATEYRLFFPATGAKMSFQLRDMRLKKNNTIPSERSFPFPSEAPTSKVIAIHAQQPR